MLSIKAIKIEVITTNGEYSFFTTFEGKLNIIRGNNTSGKSTLLNAIIYSLGMEELLGGRNESTLPYALKSKVIDADNGKEYDVISSFTFVELENTKNETITLRRSIISKDRSSKLIEVIYGKYLTDPKKQYSIQPTYIHDRGSAQSEEVGFFSVLERFIGFNLPLVPNNQGGETKLYIQTLFAAFIVEQKTGWTDYIANIPYFRIRNAAQKVVEYLLDFDVFENEIKKNDLQNLINRIKQDWKEQVSLITSFAKDINVRIKNLPFEPRDDYTESLIECEKILGADLINVFTHLENLIKEIKQINVDEINTSRGKIPEADRISFEKAIEELNVNSLQLREIKNEILLLDESAEGLQISLNQITKDIQSNKAVLKVKKLGYEHQMQIAKDICPTCHQHVADSLIQSDDQYVMSIEENIGYLESQQEMIQRHFNAKKSSKEILENQKNTINQRITILNENIKSLQRGISTIGSGSIEAEIRKKISIENEIKDIQHFIDRLEEGKEKLGSLKGQYIETLQSISELPKEYLSEDDRTKLSIFKDEFIENARLFEYSSTSLSSITIDEDKYIPYMFGDSFSMDIRSHIITEQMNKSKLKSDSSASDFVRLIWAYLLGICSTSIKKNGNHPQFIIFDEPAQHSMAITSLHSLLTKLSNENNIQSIIGASFDESTEVFKEATKGLKYHLIEIDNKLLRKNG